MLSLGIDIGSSSTKLSLLDGRDIVLEEHLLHKGRIRGSLETLLASAGRCCDVRDITCGAVTGSLDRLFADSVNIRRVNEIPAVIEGCRRLLPGVGSIIEIGGQSAKFISNLACGDDSKIRIAMNNSCSSGTGSFIEEQLSRLNLGLDDYAVMASRAKSVPRIAGRCSVFAKTDITHHLQEGVPVEDILQGLAYTLATSYRGVVVRREKIDGPVIFAGGVARNGAIALALQEELKLEDRDLLIPENAVNCTAAGAALIARREGLELSVPGLLEDIGGLDDFEAAGGDSRFYPVLAGFGTDDQRGKHDCRGGSKQDQDGLYLGIDIGSTSTNLVLLDSRGEIVCYRYLKSHGQPVETVKTGLGQLCGEYGGIPEIAGVGITGSGRYMIGRLLGADVIKDEITSQAKAAAALAGDVDTIFEIGGQDSKYIALKNGVVTDFQMNKICAAGTGSFVEEQSVKFDIPIEDFGGIALKSRTPAALGERCTVFIESSIAAKLAGGAEAKDIAAGLCYSIVNNYLNRVVGGKPLGDRILLQGGIAFNQGIVNAFRAVTGKEIIVPPYFSVTGAYGAALLAQKEMGGRTTAFTGFEPGFRECDPEAAGSNELKVTETTEFNDRVDALIFEGYDGTVDRNRKTVGIPRALFSYGMYPMFSAFFRELGYNVMLSAKSSERIIRMAQEHSSDETCYPVKLINGHIADLIEKKVDYIFFPDLYTVEHPDSSSRKDHGCAYMQLAFKIVNQTMELGRHGIELLSPTIAFNLGPGFMKNSFAELGSRLGQSPETVMKALQKGMEGYRCFEQRQAENGRRVTSGLKNNEKAFVIISKTYGVADPVLNMSIPDKLIEMGHRVLPFFDLPEGDLGEEHPNMFWPFGQHILEAAQIVKAHPNLYAVYLSHHCCGPDTVLTHYFAEIMGDKPYLNIEVDEHTSAVGIITRLEAFVNSLGSAETETAEAMNVYPERVIHVRTNILDRMPGAGFSGPLFIPGLYPYSDILAAFAESLGIGVRVLPPTDELSVKLGRKHTMTNEYFSLTCLLGDVLKAAGDPAAPENAVFFVPENAGTEADGQYSRLIRVKLDQEGFGKTDIYSPFIEDVFSLPKELSDRLFFCILAGDLVRLAPLPLRDSNLDKVLDFIRGDHPDFRWLQDMAEDLVGELGGRDFKKRIFVLGELFILNNDFANNYMLQKLEEDNHRVVYSPLGELLWMKLRDTAFENGNPEDQCRRVEEYRSYLSALSGSLMRESPYEADPEILYAAAGGITGLYAGGGGRYRGAKRFGALKGIDGILTLSSLYENTGIALDIINRGFETADSLPVLNLTFDGNGNENNRKKLDSFVHYLGASKRTAAAEKEVQNAVC